MKLFFNWRSKSIFTGKSFADLFYCEYTPKIPQGEKRPLVLFLHGAGERGNDNGRQLKNAIKKVVKKGSMSAFMDAVVLAPQCPSKLTWTNVDHNNGVYRVSQTAETEVLKKVVALVNEYRGYDHIDTSRVYVIGLSMGGYATWDLIARYPDLFAAAVPICGGGPIDKAEELKEFPIYVFHGKKDPIVAYAGSADMVAALQAAGSTSVLFKTFENGYHNIWDNAIVFAGDDQTPALAEWLFLQVKKENNEDN